MAVKANALTSLATAKEHLGLPAAADLVWDPRIEKLINRASAFCEKYTRRKLVSQMLTEAFDGRSSNRLMPKEWPVTAISALTVNGNALPSTAYEIDSDGITVVRVDGGLFPKGYRNIDLAFTAGLGTVGGDTIPDDLVHACLELVAWYYQSKSNERVGVLSRGKAGENTSYETTIPSHIALILDSYVRHEFHVGDVAVTNG